MSSCRSCRREVAADATICLKCGADLRPSKVLWFLVIGSVLLAATTTWMSFNR